jgi:hypothetical protein
VIRQQRGEAATPAARLPLVIDPAGQTSVTLDLDALGR